MSAAALRKLALALPEAAESAHMGQPDFRVRGKIFASLHRSDDFVVVMLAPEQQAHLMAAEPDIFSPAVGAWGRQGWTRVDLKSDRTTMQSALLAGWRNVAPKRVVAAYDTANGAKP